MILLLLRYVVCTYLLSLLLFLVCTCQFCFLFWLIKILFIHHRELADTQKITWKYSPTILLLSNGSKNRSFGTTSLFPVITQFRYPSDKVNLSQVESSSLLTWSVCTCTVRAIVTIMGLPSVEARIWSDRLQLQQSSTRADALARSMSCLDPGSGLVLKMSADEGLSRTHLYSSSTSRWYYVV